MVFCVILPSQCSNIDCSHKNLNHATFAATATVITTETCVCLLYIFQDTTTCDEVPTEPCGKFLSMNELQIRPCVKLNGTRTITYSNVVFTNENLKSGTCVVKMSVIRCHS